MLQTNPASHWNPAMPPQISPSLESFRPGAEDAVGAPEAGGGVLAAGVALVDGALVADAVGNEDAVGDDAGGAADVLEGSTVGLSCVPPHATRPSEGRTTKPTRTTREPVRMRATLSRSSREGKGWGAHANGRAELRSPADRRRRSARTVAPSSREA